NASFTGFSATQSGTTVKINLPTLNEGVTYRLSLSEGATDSTGNLFADIVPIEFSTYNSDSKAENLVLKDSTGNTVTSITGQTSICAEAELEPVAGDKLTLIVAAYGSGVPKAVGFKQGSGTVKTDLISLTSADSVRAWIISEKFGVVARTSILDTSDDMFYYPAERVSDSYKLTSAYYETDKFLLNVNYSGNKRKAFAMVSDMSGNVIAAGEFDVEKDGLMPIDTRNISVSEGRYSVATTLIGGGAMQTQDTYYIGADEAAGVLSSLNAAQSMDDVLELMNSYPYLFRVDNISKESLLEHISLVLYEGKTYPAFADVYDMIELAQESLETLNLTDWSLLDDYFANHPEALGNSEARQKYNELSEDARLVICKACADIMPIDSFVTLRSRLEKFIREYEEKGVIDSATKTEISGIGGYNNTEYGSDYKDYDIPAIGFTDIGNYVWAEQSIMTLVENNIIAVPQDKKFRPQDKITRAEFVKLLVKVIGLDISDSTSIYTDTKEGDWYTPYFTAANKAGIITGYADGTVKPNDTISRQDIAVILERTLKYSEITLTINNSEAVISDYDTISDYAKAAVEMVVECSLMKGVGNDTFAPWLSTDRASAAVIAARLFKGMQSGAITEDVLDDNTDILSMQEYLLLNAIGVIDEDDSICRSSAITRRELARVIHKIVLNNIAVSSENQNIEITDIKKNDPDFDAIHMVCDLGYMTASDGAFRPDEPINMPEFARGAVGILGYRFMAEGMGGYPVGYMNVCSQLKLFKKGYLDASSNINNVEFMNLLFNVLQAAPAEFSGITDNDFSTYTVNDYNTLLYQKFDVYKLRGLLEADMFSDILKRKPRVGSGQLIISGKKYPTTLKDVNGLVGHIVEAFVHKEYDSVIALSSYNTEEVSFLPQHMDFSEGRIRYSLDGGDTYSDIKYLNNVSLLYNGRLVSFNKELFNDVNGQIFAIDYNSDKVADVIKIYNYSTLQISDEGVREGIIGDALGGKSINLNNKVQWEDFLLYKNGKTVTLEELEKDDIVSYIEIVDEPKLIILHACDKSIDG
ncbi:MAG: S-layer homology domain-containing protein, partial [Clostridia bacterium]|nr:S-layer homology domain-containing protein [Clostridia bacterium]